MQHFTTIVLGVGSMGSAACYYLARSGVKVLGLEQFSITHELGSHTGQSRIIRKAYFEHPDYVPLLERAYHNWRELEVASSTQLYFPIGLLYAGRVDGVLIKGVTESAKLYGVEVNKLTSDEVRTRFPQFEIPVEYEILFEPDAGFLTPERCIQTFAEQAIRNGAVIHTNEKVISWKQQGELIIVATNRQTYTCDKLIITAGPWAKEFLPSLLKHLTVTLQVLVWTTPHQPEQYQPDKFPCWLIDDPDQPGMYYGFPWLDESTFGTPAGLKSAYHYPGQPTYANQVDREVKPEEINQLTTAIKRYLPTGFQSIQQTKTCLYTNTPDENFIIDFLPENKQVIVAAGFSGHGFKFASAVGEILSDLASVGKTELPIDFLKASRFNQ
jgi:sarcosine oxidase